LIEVVTGQTLDKVLQDQMFKSLAMIDTSFVVPLEKQHRTRLLTVSRKYLGEMATEFFNPAILLGGRKSVVNRGGRSAFQPDVAERGRVRGGGQSGFSAGSRSN
jgi:CubicO group peptidase (beta-lactamase class C family)